MKCFTEITLLCLLTFLLPLDSSGSTGCCSRHGGVDYCDESAGYFRCKDGLLSPCPCVPVAPFKRSARVVSVIEGQYIEVEHEGVKSRIGLYGVVGVEEKTAIGDRAKQFVSNAALNKMINFEPVLLDRRGQQWAWVWIESENLNKELVRQGLAYWDRKQAPKDKELEALETEAKKNKLGLWGSR